MAWHRVGRIFGPENNFEWMVSHAANPFAEHIEQSLYRIYFSCRDRFQRSSIGSVVFDIDKLSVLEIASRPTISIGERGSFDDSGASVGCIVSRGHDRYLYYLGWNLGVTVPFRNSIGLAISRDGSEFNKFGGAPILDRNMLDPYSVSYPWVLKEGESWRMWYGSTTRWWPVGGEQDHVIKYAESPDGIHWKPTGIVCIDAIPDTGYSCSRPCVQLESGRYRMWFSFRGARYSIGYAESSDGIHWERIDEPHGLDPGEQGWESQSVEYAHIFRHAENQYILYCGNGYGKTGFGLAVWH